MSLVRYEGPMDPPETPFDSQRQVVYLYALEQGMLRSQAARRAGVRLAQVNALRNRDRHFAELEAASLEVAAEGMLDATKTLAEQGDVRAFEALMKGYFMSGTFGQGPATVNNTQIIIESGQTGVREALEQLRRSIAERASQVEPSASRELG